MMLHGAEKEESAVKTERNLMHVTPVNQENLMIQPYVSPSIYLEVTQVTPGEAAWTLPNLLTGIRYRHGEVKFISCDTLAGLMQGGFDQVLGPATVYQIIDCRHPFEFMEGHIMGAQNLHTRDQIQKDFFLEKMEVDGDVVEMDTDTEEQPQQQQQQQLLRRPCIYVFYCEFSLEQAPKLLHFLYSKDQDHNYPEVYLLQDGYTGFSYLHPQLCSKADVAMESSVDIDELLDYPIDGEVMF